VQLVASVLSAGGEEDPAAAAINAASAALMCSGGRGPGALGPGALRGWRCAHRWVLQSRGVRRACYPSLRRVVACKRAAAEAAAPCAPPRPQASPGLAPWPP
jgi:hypothetical protein